MSYIVDDTRGVVVGAPTEGKKFPWGLISLLAVAGTITAVAVAKKEG